MVSEEYQSKLDRIDVLQREHNKLEKSIKDNAAMYKLWKTGKVFEGLHDGFTMDQEAEFYNQKLKELIKS